MLWNLHTDTSMIFPLHYIYMCVYYLYLWLYSEATFFLLPCSFPLKPFSLFHHFLFSLSLSDFMAAFSSYQQHSFLLDSIFHPSTTPMFSPFYPYETLGNNNNEVSEQSHMNYCTDQSSSVADYMPENENLVTNTMDKKRKKIDGVSSTSSVQPKEGKEVKGKRQRKKKEMVEDNEGNKGKKSATKEKKKVPEEAPTDYIHVRARRGQATDSHSLAERVRREKISERMKVLQTLVPGCDKVTGKALMLDEIINYVQSLQHQVEFLSMKLGTLNPTLYDFGIDLDALMITPERLNKLMSPILFSNMEKYNSALPAAFSEATTPSIYPQLFPQGQTATTISPEQVVDDRRQGGANQCSSYQLHQLVGFPLL